MKHKNYTRVGFLNVIENASNMMFLLSVIQKGLADFLLQEDHANGTFSGDFKL
jgi:hypothetical protein